MVFENKVDKFEISEFLREVSKAINKYGIRRIISSVKSIQEDGYQDNVSIVINFTCDAFEISKDDLFSNKKGICNDARNVCYILLSEKIQLSQNQIATHFSRTYSAVSRGIKEINNLDPKLKQDKFILDKLEKIRNDL